MSIIDAALDRLALRLNQHIQGDTPSQKFRDHREKGARYSVESEISETLADIILGGFALPVAGESERAMWLDSVSERFVRRQARLSLVTAFVSGDCIVVPSWNGRNIQNVVIPSEDFIVTECFGDEITACAYVLDRKERNDEVYKLMQAIELVPYETAGGVTYANCYRAFIARGDSPAPVREGVIPEWDAFVEDGEWHVPNVDRLLVGRFRSSTIDPNCPNAVKGAPICFGASEPISEIHYLLSQMHDEFQLSEKMVMAGKRLFQREWHGDEAVTVLPRGKDRLIMTLGGQTDQISEWSPDIRYQAYLEAIDKQEQLVERAVGVSSGIISRPNDMNYQNVDNVRKSQQKTISFVNTARRQAESMLDDLLYAWDVLANYFGISPVAPWERSFDWSDDYIETFADKQAAILAGNAIGATDAVDFRMFLFDESPEAARERVEEIKAAQSSSASVLMPLA